MLVNHQFNMSRTFSIRVSKFLNPYSASKLGSPTKFQQVHTFPSRFTTCRLYCTNPTQEDPKYHPPHSTIVNQLTEIENKLRVRGYSTVRWGILAVGVTAYGIYLFRHQIRDNVHQEVTQVATRSLGDEEVREKAEELSKALLHAVLTDKDIHQRSVLFLTEALNDPTTLESLSSLLQSLLSEPETQQQITATMKQVTLQAFGDEEFRNNLAELLKQLFKHDSVKYAVTELLKVVFNDDTVKLEAAAFFKYVLGTDIVTSQAQLLGKEVLAGIASDENVRNTVGSGIVSGIWQAITPRFSRKKPRQDSQEPVDDKPETESKESHENLDNNESHSKGVDNQAKGVERGDSEKGTVTVDESKSKSKEHEEVHMNKVKSQSKELAYLASGLEEGDSGVEGGSEIGIESKSESKESEEVHISKVKSQSKELENLASGVEEGDSEMGTVIVDETQNELENETVDDTEDKTLDVYVGEGELNINIDQYAESDVDENESSSEEEVQKYTSQESMLSAYHELDSVSTLNGNNNDYKDGYVDYSSENGVLKKDSENDISSIVEESEKDFALNPGDDVSTDSTGNSVDEKNQSDSVFSDNPNDEILVNKNDGSYNVQDNSNMDSVYSTHDASRNLEKEGTAQNADDKDCEYEVNNKSIGSTVQPKSLSDLSRKRYIDHKLNEHY